MYQARRAALDATKAGEEEVRRQRQKEASMARRKLAEEQRRKQSARNFFDDTQTLNELEWYRSGLSRGALSRHYSEFEDLLTEIVNDPVYGRLDFEQLQACAFEEMKAQGRRHLAAQREAAAADEFRRLYPVSEGEGEEAAAAAGVAQE
jgi:hypothetical protein